MKVTIVGTGYVGLSTGVVLAYLGHEVSFLDVDQEKISHLTEGKLPFFEPGLREILDLVGPQINFTTSYENAVSSAQVLLITVGTPNTSSGEPDLSFLENSAKEISKYLNQESTVIAIKSTAPIGSGKWLKMLVQQHYQSQNGKCDSNAIAIASNPEFLREGTALHDSFYPWRIVVGSDNPQATETLYHLYKPLLEQSFTPPEFLPRPEGLGAIPFLTMDFASAELIKYASNSFLSVKISFVNEIANLAEKIGADIGQVAKGLGLDPRIGTRFLNAGIGWGGSCLGKDAQALVSIAKKNEISMPILDAAREVNRKQRERVIKKLELELGDLSQRTIGFLGLAFKPFTDDLRDAPAIDIISKLSQGGVKVRVHDPQALELAKKALNGYDITFCPSPDEAILKTDAVVLTTEWPEYQNINWVTLAKTMKNPLIIDGRNFLNPKKLSEAGFKYVGFGK